MTGDADTCRAERLSIATTLNSLGERSGLQPRITVLMTVSVVHAIALFILAHQFSQGAPSRQVDTAISAAEFPEPGLLVQTAILSLPNSEPQSPPRDVLTAMQLSSIPAPQIQALIPELGPMVILDDAPKADLQVSSQPPAGETKIRCEVHIHQSPSGQVQSVDFGDCTGDDRWQTSLLQNIQRAAALVSPIEGNPFPPVRVFYFTSASISPIVLARQLVDEDMVAPVIRTAETTDDLVTE